MSVQVSGSASLTDVTHSGRNSKIMVPHATHRQSQEEPSVRFAQKVLGTGLGEIGYVFLGEVKENSKFFLTHSFLFCQKSSTNILMSSWWFYHRKYSWKDNLLARDEQGSDIKFLSSGCIQNSYKICSQRMQKTKIGELHFPIEININLSFSRNPFSFLQF